MRFASGDITGSSHFLARVDSRLKLLASLALLVMVVSHRGIWFPLLTAVAGVGTCFTLGVRLRLLLLRFSEPLVIALVVLVLKALFSGHDLLWSYSIGGFAVTCHQDGLLEGCRIAGRIMGAVAVVATVGFATPFTEILAALAWLKVPQGLIEVTMFAWRYLFVLADDAQVVYAAQRNRLGYVGYRRSFRSFGTLAGALVIKAFDTSQTMTTAMVQRGYDGSLPMLKHKPFRLGEVASALLVVLAMGVLWQI
ncbi:cobalt ECF transporter T component CbiQ [Geobacter pelophilus]|uniref:Cobalt ECF transporter T component CbiQ n=1 Tax=Geoanaerobacter pelophilus TaxID=60036 RepID=A0AAW4L6N8_9BACT|nr:cobalt ECF transporter T component CbiQ [Geoanaerobacter pelophilus]MBT0663906.1 cobalt ECF transporter T component CbiQ [Geoanaerobacter pelophilus]